MPARQPSFGTPKPRPYYYPPLNKCNCGPFAGNLTRGSTRGSTGADSQFTIYRKYKEEYVYTLRQIRIAQQNPVTPRKKDYGHKPTIPIEKAKEMKACLLSDPSHRHISFHHLPALAPELGLQGYKYEAIRSAFLRVGYRRRVTKRKGFSDDLAVMANRLAFVEDGLTWRSS